MTGYELVFNSVYSGCFINLDDLREIPSEDEMKTISVRRRKRKVTLKG